MFASLKLKRRISELEEQAKNFQVSTDAYLIDNLERATQNELVDDALLAEHTRNFVAHKELFNTIWNRYMKLKKRFAKNDKLLLCVTEQWREYGEAWFITSINHYDPEELRKQADYREKIVKKFETWGALSDDVLNLAHGDRK